MRSQSASYHGYRFPPDIISHAVWLYHRFCLSFRDAEDLLAQRGVTVTYETIRQWCQRFDLFRGNLRGCRYPVWCNKAAEVGESAKQGRCEWLLPQ